MDAENRKDVERRLIETEAVIERCSCDETGKDKVKIRGYAAVFYRDDSPAESKDLGGFTERIMPGAFDEAIKRGTDVVALYNHDPMFVLGRESAGTLRINVDERGLRYEIDAPESQPAIIEAISRGDVRGSSFAFKVKPEGERWQRDADGRNIRMIDSVDGLYDVGPVLSPAYPSSESFVSQRALNLAQEQAITPSGNPDISDPDELEEDEIESGLRSEDVNPEAQETREEKDEEPASNQPTAGTLSPSNYDLYERCDQIVEENGLWPQEGPRGCQYQQRSMYGSQGVKCENCVFYNSDNSCDIVEGEIRADGICRFWQIPEERLSMEEELPSEEQGEAETEESRQETAEEKAEVFDTDATIARLKAASLKGH